MSVDPTFVAIWVVIGIVIGVVTSFIVKAGSLGLIGDGIAGLVGAVIAGYVLPRMGVYIDAPASYLRSSTPSSDRSSWWLSHASSKPSSSPRVTEPAQYECVLCATIRLLSVEREHVLPSACT
jgi:uncharacterized membrane protein YeaQ/YmgE (transglycosylase-associated protein family)